MSSDLNQLVQGIVEQRAASLSEFEADKDKLEQIASALRSVKTSELRSKADFRGLFDGIPFKTMEDKLGNAKEKLDLALARLSRKNISIAVAGGARQGKSQMLQMLTGLTDEQIPTGDGNFCTATSSEIINDRNNPARALAYFFTEREMLDVKILPYYQEGNSKSALNLKPVPTSVEDFVRSPLPPLPEESNDPSNVKFYEILKELHEGLQDDEVRNLIGMSPREIPFDDLRPYVTKDDDTAVKFFNAVKKVEISTPFDVDLPNGMKVFDLPGLGEMSTSIRANMLRAVKEDADIVMMLRRPDPSGDGWKEADFDILDALKGVFAGTADFKPCDWVALVLNKDERSGRENGKNVSAMAKNPPDGFKPIVCNCGDKEDVRRVVVSNMELLLENAHRIDGIRIEDARKSFNEVIDECKNIKDKLEQIYATFVNSKTDIDQEGLFQEFLGDLRGPFKVSAEQQLNELHLQCREVMMKKFAEIYDRMDNEYKTRETDFKKAFPAEFPVFTVAKLENMFKGVAGPDGACDEGVRNQLWAILNLFREVMTKCCEQVREHYFNCMAKLIIDSNSAITKLVNNESGLEMARSEDKLKMLKEVMERKNNTREVQNVLSALQNLLSVQMSYEGHILPFFQEHKGLNHFDPYYELLDEDKKQKKDKDGKKAETELYTIKSKIRSEGTKYDKQADILFNWMKEKTIEVFTRSEDSTKIFNNILQNIFRTFKANYQNFALQFIWGKNIESEWRKFTAANQVTLWRDIYKQRAKEDELSGKLEAMLSAFSETVKNTLPEQ